MRSGRGRGRLVGRPHRSELQARVGANGYTLREGPILEKTVLRFRSFVNEPMRFGNLLLAGDAAHTVPPTGAKLLNLAWPTSRGSPRPRAVLRGKVRARSTPTPTGRWRGGRSQHFSYSMTTMLHRLPDASEFDVRRELAELSSVVTSRAGATFLAEGYTGWPSTGP